MENYEMLSRFYDKFLLHEVDYERYCSFILNEYKKGSASFCGYLDLACGTGNFSSIISSNFKDTTCIDISENMLSIAYNKFLDKKINANFIQSDICNFKFREQFSLITCGLDSINYILEEQDLLNCFKCTYDSLIDDGLFVFDINSKYKIENALGDNIFVFDEDGIFCVWENQYEDNIVDMYLTFFVEENSIYRRYEEDQAERAYEIAEVLTLLKEAGFKNIKYFNDYSYDEVVQNTDRITFVIRK